MYRYNQFFAGDGENMHYAYVGVNILNPNCSDIVSMKIKFRKKLKLFGGPFFLPGLPYIFRQVGGG